MISISEKKELAIVQRVQVQRVQKTIALLLVGMVIGCGGNEYEGQWPDRSRDYQKVVADRGMAMLWGVIISVEKPGGTAATLSDEGEYGTEEGAADVTTTLDFGGVQLQLKAVSGKSDFGLIVNSKRYGRVKPGNRVRVDPVGGVYVNDNQREGK